MAQENKTEKATPYRRRKLRSEGNVAKSIDVATSLTVLASTIVLFFTGYALFKITAGFLRTLSTVNYDNAFATIDYLLKDISLTLSKTLAPLFIVVILVVIASFVAQFGFIFTLKPLGFKWERINPFEGLKRMFSLTTLFELFKNLLKVSILIGVAYFIVHGSIEHIVGLPAFPLNESVISMLKLIFTVVLTLGIFAFGVALLDLAYKRWDYERRIRMSREEVKEEYKQFEGNPEVKGKLRAKMRELARGRMMAEVPKASVVITNPTHIAIALRYNAETDKAPVVVAKGKGAIAEKIVEIAEKYNVPVIRREEVARALYPLVDVGQEIPPSFYKAVAEIIAFVMFKKKKKVYA